MSDWSIASEAQAPADPWTVRSAAPADWTVAAEGHSFELSDAHQGIKAGLSEQDVGLNKIVETRRQQLGYQPQWQVASEKPAETKAYTSEILPLSRDSQGNLHLAVPGIVTSIAKGIESAVTLPGDVYQGKASDTDTGRVLGLATLASPVSVARGTGAAIARAAIPRDLPEAVAQSGTHALTVSPELDVLRAEAARSPEQPPIAATVQLSEKTPQLVEPILKEPFSRNVNGAVKDMLAAGDVKLAPDIQIADQVRDLLQTNIIPPETFNAILEKNGVKPEQFLAEMTQGTVGQGIRESATLAGRTLQQLSELRKLEVKIRTLSGEIPAGEDEVGTNAYSYIQRVGNIWRGLLVSQLATAVRNAESQAAMGGIDVLQRGFERGLRTVFGNPMRRLLGKEPVTDPIDAFGSVAMMLKPKEAARLTDAIASVKPSVRESLFSRYSSDVNRATGGKGVLGKVEGAVDALNWANRTQEFFFRRAFFAESLQRNLEGRGMNLGEIVAQNKIGKIPEDAIKAAITDALEKTFAEPLPSRATFAGDLLGAMSRIPFSPIPFVRFMHAALKFQFEYSPLGAVRLLSPSELKALASGEPEQLKIASKALAGSTLLYSAYLLRQSHYAGPKWYQIRIDGNDYDTRAYNPFASYLFVGDLIKRFQDGTMLGMNIKDIAQGIASVNFRSGAGLYIVDQLINDLAGVDSNRKLFQVMETYAGNVVSGFATPFQMLKDAIGQFIPEERVVRETSGSPLIGPTLTRLPFADRGLPPAQSPTHSGGYERRQPLLRQLAGLTINSKSNAAEDELKRLGFTGKDVLPRSGDPDFDSTVAKEMGPIFEKVMVPLVQSPRYLAIKSNKAKAAVLSKIIPAIRRAALDKAIKDDPTGYLRSRYQRLPQRERALIEEYAGEHGLKLPSQLKGKP